MVLQLFAVGDLSNMSARVKTEWPGSPLAGMQAEKLINVVGSKQSRKIYPLSLCWRMLNIKSKSKQPIWPSKCCSNQDNCPLPPLVSDPERGLDQGIPHVKQKVFICLSLMPQLPFCLFLIVTNKTWCHFSNCKIRGHSMGIAKTIRITSQVNSCQYPA